MRFSARILLVSLILLITSLFTAPAFAQTNMTPNTNEDVPRNLHYWTQNVMIEVMSAAVCQLVGKDPIDPSQKCLGIDRETGKIGLVENSGGAVSVMTGMIGMLYVPPIHFNEYSQYLAANFGIAKPSYAQGVGFDGLNPLIRAWSAFRNIAYVFFVIIFVLIGMAVMLRIRIDPRTVMTIQNQIPKIIVALVLVTFSFAIAGLMVDFMWITTYLIVSLFTMGSPPLINDPTIANKLSTSPLGFANDFFIGGIGGIASGASDAVNAVIINSFNIPVISCANGDVLCIIGSVVDPGKLLGTFATSLIGLAAFLILIVAVLWALFRLWFTLIKSYIYILISVIFGPIWILSGLVPGAKSGFGSWLRSLVANLMVFPITLGMFMIGRFFMESYTFAPSSKNFLPPLLANPGNIGIFGPIIGIGIILILPSVADISKRLFGANDLQAGDPLKAFGVGQAVVGATAGYSWNRLMRPAEQYRDAGFLRQQLSRRIGGRVPDQYEETEKKQVAALQGFARARWNFAHAVFGKPKKLVDARLGERPIIKEG